MTVLRHRRLRKSGFLRDFVSETSLSPGDFILPYFVTDGVGIKSQIEGMPGMYNFSVDTLTDELSEIPGLKSVLLFGITREKDEKASGSFRPDGIVQKTIRKIKKEFSDLIILTDVCLCGYASHGHCGIVNGERIDNDATLEVLRRIAVSHAEAGADFVAPSAMMDGQVGAIRDALDSNGFKDTGIMSYSAKYASSFYGPFRDVMDSSPLFGDRKTYQMDYRNSDEALREVKVDINEGADIVMVKPALAYLDIIYRVKKEFNVPVAAYNVSGEYAMVKSYCQETEEEKKIILEILTAIKRAGADFIISYSAKEAIDWLK